MVSKIDSTPTRTRFKNARSQSTPVPRALTHAPAAPEQLDAWRENTGQSRGPAFARHETFAPRFGWLRKGFTAVTENPRFFLQKDAHLQIGVGKNQARAIRYWCHAFDLLEHVSASNERTAGSGPTDLGRCLLGPWGWDPYLEDPASTWFLHWRLVRRAFSATAWHYAFTILPDIEFTVEGLTNALSDYASVAFPTARTARSSFYKDASCIARMYFEAATDRNLTEESIQSPFAELGLLTASGPASAQRYRFCVDTKRSLPAAVVAAACLEFAAVTSPTARTVSVSRLLSDPGSPGMAFKLGESALTDYLEQVSSTTRGVSLTDAAGLVQFGFRSDPASLVVSILRTYYTSTRKSVIA